MSNRELTLNIIGIWVIVTVLFLIWGEGTIRDYLAVLGLYVVIFGYLTLCAGVIYWWSKIKGIPLGSFTEGQEWFLGIMAVAGVVLLFYFVG